MWATHCERAQLVTGSADCTVRVWQLARNVRKPSQAEAELKGTAFDHDGVRWTPFYAHTA